MTKKKPTKKYLTNQCDMLFGQIIRAPGRCADCGSTEVVQCAHLISRSYHAIRWSELNAVPLCRRHHLYFTHHPVEWHVWVDTQFGTQRWHTLMARALTYERPDLVELRERLRDRLAEIELAA